MSFHDDDYKLVAEDFVSGLTGTTNSEVVLLVCMLPATLWMLTELRALLFSRLATIDSDDVHDDKELAFHELSVAFLLELIVFIMPIIISFTFTEYAPSMLVFILLVSLLLNVGQRFTMGDNMRKHARKLKARHFLLLYQGKPLPFLSSFRSCMMLSTIICILAVDFTVFPRHNAKTESFGMSLMDLGVGTFVFSLAVVSPTARKATKFKSQHKSRRIQTSFASAVLKAVRSTLPLTTIGVSRLVVIKALRYQEHASEYGTHWNFFFTLSVLAVLGALFDCVEQSVTEMIGNEKHWVPIASLCSASVVVVYQLCLSSGLSEFILHAPRTIDPDALVASRWPDMVLWLFYHDREGICSLAGFFAIYLQGVQLSQWCLFRDAASGSGFKVINSWIENLALIFVIDSVLWLVFFASTMNFVDGEEHEDGGVSRRMVNGAYCLWVVAICTLLVGLFLAIDLLSTIPLSSVVIRAINRNQLAIFLVGNVLTGLVNLSMKTIYATTEVGFLVISMYTVTVCLVAVLLDKFGIWVKI
jgi:phosphatidylinositol glycan class W